jgi:uncharacterized protein YeaO (DUF488 family)
MLVTKRVYEPFDIEDGTRLLVERLWPRGIKKEALKMDAWMKEVSPSDGLRRWFNHDPEKWNEFTKRYSDELMKRPQAWQPILKSAVQGRVTLLYSARDEKHNNAVALKAFLEERIAARE